MKDYFEIVNKTTKFMRESRTISMDLLLLLKLSAKQKIKIFFGNSEQNFFIFDDKIFSGAARRKSLR